MDSNTENTISVMSRRDSSSVCISHSLRNRSNHRLAPDSSAPTKRFRNTSQLKPSCWKMPVWALLTTRFSAREVSIIPMTEVSGTMLTIFGRMRP